MRILYLITGLLHGGAEVQLLELSKRIKKQGHDVVVVSVLPEGGYADEINANGIEVKSINVSRSALDLRAVPRLVRIVRAFRPDVVHSLMVHSNLLSRLVRVFSRYPVLVNTALAAKENRSVAEGTAVREFLYRISDRFSDATTQVSEVCADRYVRVRAVPRHKMRVVPCGVDTRVFSVLEEGERTVARAELGTDPVFRWLAVGRLVDVKDHVTGVAAFALATGAEDNCELVIRGAGSSESDVRNAAAQYGIVNRVQILLERRDISRLMNGADALLISSVVEGMPTVALEAAACGLPIVATDAGGNREIVIDGVNGFIAPSRDPEALAEAMRKVMHMSPKARRAMGLAGRKLVEEKFDFEIVAAKYEELYRELLEKKGYRV